jgi:hypothetical protein
MVKEDMPEEIWLIEDYQEGVPCFIWCDDPNPSGNNETVSFRYIRADCRTTMTKREALEILKHYQHWRRGGDGDMPDPKQIGEAIDVAIAALAEASHR